MVKKPRIKTPLSRLENTVMAVLWQHGEASAEQVREALAEQRVLKDSTVRTLLRRMEGKGVVDHRTEGRTYIYRPVVERHHMAVDEARNIVERFCSGSTASLIQGMASDRMISPDELRRLADQIERAQTGDEVGATRSAEPAKPKRSGRNSHSAKPRKKGE